MPMAVVNIYRNLIDNESSVNILYSKTFAQMGIPRKISTTLSHKIARL